MSQKLRLARVLTLTVALAFALPAAEVPAQNEGSQPAEQQDQQKQQNEKKKGKEKEQKEAKQLQVFHLKHSKPQEIMQLLSIALTTRSPDTQNDQVTPLQPEFVAAQFAAQYPGSAPIGDLRIAADEELSVLFVRAPQKKLDEVKKLISAFDIPTAEVQKKEFNGLLIAPLPNEKANRVLAIFQQLDINAVTLNVGEKQLLVIDIQQSETAEQAKQILEAFEAREKPDQPKENTEGRKGKDMHCAGGLVIVPVESTSNLGTRSS